MYFKYKSSGLRQHLALDISLSSIEEARRRTSKSDNLLFVHGSLDQLNDLQEFDVAIVSLVFHHMKPEDALALLHGLKAKCKRILIAGFVQSNSWYANGLLKVDQLFSGKYHRFRQHLAAGGVPNLLSQCGLVFEAEHATRDASIRIFEVVV